MPQKCLRTTQDVQNLPKWQELKKNNWYDLHENWISGNIPYIFFINFSQTLPFAKSLNCKCNSLDFNMCACCPNFQVFKLTVNVGCSFVIWTVPLGSNFGKKTYTSHYSVSCDWQCVYFRMKQNKFEPKNCVDRSVSWEIYCIICLIF